MCTTKLWSTVTPPSIPSIPRRTSTMGRTKRLPGGIGATGSALARFFHPSAKVREKWADHAKRRLAGVLITGKGTHRINRKDQLSYECRIPEIDDSTTFFVCCNNFKVEVAGATPFDDEQENVATPQRTATDNTRPLREATENIQNNVTNVSRGATAADVAALRSEGIEVDNEDPAPENRWGPTPAENTMPGEWVKETICPRKADGRISDCDGMWRDQRWSAIALMDEFALFRLCFPESFFLQILIPQTNKHLEGPPIDLHEFYVWLGCRFYMACFQGISEINLWWSEKKT